MLNGVIVKVDAEHQCGTIRGDDGRIHPFEREDMVRWLQFGELRRGVRVQFEVQANGAAFNVERVPRSGGPSRD